MLSSSFLTGFLPFIPHSFLLALSIRSISSLCLRLNSSLFTCRYFSSLATRSASICLNSLSFTGSSPYIKRTGSTAAMLQVYSCAGAISCFCPVCYQRTGVLLHALRLYVSSAYTFRFRLRQQHSQKPIRLIFYFISINNGRLSSASVKAT